MKLRCFLFFIFFCYQVLGQSPTVVWTRKDGGDRNELVFFQKSVMLEETPITANLYLYADSRYALYVNGTYVNFGPVRSFHEHPYYDSYDLAPLLRKGENCLVVKALNNGLETYQLFDYHGGFAAWGEIKTRQNRKIDLSSLEWRCRTSEGFQKDMPRFSFATGAIENWDTSKDMGWDHCNSKDGNWQTPVVVGPKKWGVFQARPIPKLTQTEIVAEAVRGPFPLLDTEDLYSFRIPTPDRNGLEYNTSQKAIGYTYLFSETEKKVNLGLWWGDYYLNGKPLPPNNLAEEATYRRNHTGQLHKGWNLLVVKYSIIWGSWDFYLAVPKKERITVSAERKKAGTNWFKTFLPQNSKNQRVYDAVDLTKKELSLEEAFNTEFIDHPKSITANHPVRDMVWKTPGKRKSMDSIVEKDQARSFKLAAQGTGLQYEMEETQLGRFFVEGDFPKGTVIDIGFSEEKHVDGGPWLYKRFQVAAGLRIIADGVARRYESFKPYGAKYLQLNLYGPENAVSVEKVGMVRQVYPFQTIGRFECNDSVVNKIYGAGWRTLQLCAEDSYTDTPFRERGLYAGDMLPELAITMAMSGDMRLAKHSLAVFQDMYKEEMRDGKQNRHNDFPLITLLTADYLKQYTGDSTLAKDYYENYASLLKQHLARKGTWGLVHADRVFIEWTDLNKEDAYMTAFQALLVKSLRTIANWASELGKVSDARFFNKEADMLTTAINTHLWDADKGMYIDGVKNNNKIVDHHLTSSIWPAFFEVADTAQITAILSNLKKELGTIGTVSRKRKITPYSSFYLFALLYRHGEIATAEAFLKRHWAPMAEHSSRPTTWENFDIQGNQGTSSHAWSGHPTYFLATAALGVQLGWYQNLDREIIQISPQSSHLEWAKGTVMHPAGPVTVSWTVVNDELHLRYNAPKGKKVNITPKGRLGKLSLKVVHDRDLKSTK